MTTREFFTNPTDQSRVKVEIVTKYFRAWANVMVPTVQNKRGMSLGYVDLYSGPGQYDDGTKSTPALIIEEAIRDESLRGLLMTRFNDVKAENITRLKGVLSGLPGFGTLKHQPRLGSEEVTDKFAEIYEKTRLPPTLFFLDPWGYRGLSLRLIRACTRPFGCDCIFFFNYKRVNAGLENDLFAEHMDAIFGIERAVRLRSRLDGLSPKMREQTIVAELLAALKEECGRFALQFPFSTDTGTQTSHYLMFVSKGKKAYDIMKEIMARRSSSHPQGVPSLCFNPRELKQAQLLLDKPLDRLEAALLEVFAGRQLTVEQVFTEHNVGTNYLLSNYKEVLRQLEEKGAVEASPIAETRPKLAGDKVSMADDVIITFPKA